MEYNGGVQQLISAIDVYYKSLTSQLGEGEFPFSFAYVTGFPGISSTKYGVRINYFHIFQPSLFLAVASHEACNYYLRKINLYAKGVGDEIDRSGNTVFEIFHNVVSFLEGQMVDEDIIPEDHDLKDFPHINSFYQDIKDQGLFHWLFCDIIAYYVTYNGNFKLFTYWQWSYFLQMPEINTREYGKPREVELDYFLTKLIFLEIFFEKKDYLECPIESMQSYWDDSYLRLRDLVEKTLAQDYDEIVQWMKNVDLLAKTILLRETDLYRACKPVGEWL